MRQGYRDSVSSLYLFIFNQQGVSRERKFHRVSVELTCHRRTLVGSYLCGERGQFSEVPDLPNTSGPVSFVTKKFFIIIDNINLINV